MSDQPTISPPPVPSPPAKSDLASTGGSTPSSASSENSASSAVQASYQKSSQASSSPPLTTEVHHSQSKVPLLLGLTVLVLGLLGGGYYLNLIQLPTLKPPLSYEECLTTPGRIIQESYPQVCVTKSGAHFTQPLPSSSPISDPTANWKTYTDAEYGFTFKHPIEAQVSKQGDGTLILLIDSTVSIPEACNGFQLRVYPADPSMSQTDSTEYTSIKIGNRPAKRLDTISSMNNFTCAVSSVAVPSLDNPQKTDFIMRAEHLPNEYNATFNLILSTFQFLD